MINNVIKTKTNIEAELRILLRQRLMNLSMFQLHCEEAIVALLNKATALENECIQQIQTAARDGVESLIDSWAGAQQMVRSSVKNEQGLANLKTYTMSWIDDITPT